MRYHPIAFSSLTLRGGYLFTVKALILADKTYSTRRIICRPLIDSAELDSVVIIHKPMPGSPMNEHTVY
jgi:hypothetical protein